MIKIIFLIEWRLEKVRLVFQKLNFWEIKKTVFFRNFYLNRKHVYNIRNLMPKL